MLLLCSSKMAQSLMTFAIAVTLCTAFTLPKTYGDSKRVLDKVNPNWRHNLFFIHGEMI